MLKIICVPQFMHVLHFYSLNWFKDIFVYSIACTNNGEFIQPDLLRVNYSTIIISRLHYLPNTKLGGIKDLCLICLYKKIFKLKNPFDVKVADYVIFN